MSVRALGLGIWAVVMFASPAKAETSTTWRMMVGVEGTHIRSPNARRDHLHLPAGWQGGGTATERDIDWRNDASLAIGLEFPYGEVGGRGDGADVFRLLGVFGGSWFHNEADWLSDAGGVGYGGQMEHLWRIFGSCGRAGICGRLGLGFRIFRTTVRRALPEGAVALDADEAKLLYGEGTTRERMGTDRDLRFIDYRLLVPFEIHVPRWCVTVGVTAGIGRAEGVRDLRPEEQTPATFQHAYAAYLRYTL